MYYACRSQAQHAHFVARHNTQQHRINQMFASNRNGHSIISSCTLYTIVSPVSEQYSTEIKHTDEIHLSTIIFPVTIQKCTVENESNDKCRQKNTTLRVKWKSLAFGVQQNGSEWCIRTRFRITDWMYRLSISVLMANNNNNIEQTTAICHTGNVCTHHNRW